VTHVQALDGREASDTDQIADELGEEERWFAERSRDSQPTDNAPSEEKMSA